MIKITTSHGTQYLIDYKLGRAKRINNSGHEMHNDDKWFGIIKASAYDRNTLEDLKTPIVIGKAIFFQTRQDSYDWRISSNVVSIEEIENE